MAQRTVYCLTATRPSAGRILVHLRAAGIPGSEISLLYLRTLEIDDGVRTAGAKAKRDDVPIPTAPDDGRSPWLPLTGPLLLPGSRPLVGAGPLGEVLRSTKFPSLVASLSGAGLPSVESKRYGAGIEQGGVLLAVHAANPDKSDSARAIFRAEGATDVFTMLEVSTRTRSGPGYTALRNFRAA